MYGSPGEQYSHFPHEGMTTSPRDPRLHDVTPHDRVYDTRTLMAAMIGYMEGRPEIISRILGALPSARSKMFIRMAHSRERNLYSTSLA